MKVLFLAKDFIIEPLGIAYLSAYLKAAGHETALVRPDKQDALSFIKQWQPHVLAYSVMTSNFRYYQQLNLELKQHCNAISLFGGPHVTFFPEFAEQEGVDLAIAGEGFEAIVDVVQALEEHRDPYDIPNLVWFDGRLHRNPLRTPIDVSTLLFPDRSIVYQAPKNRNNPIRSFMASWGCLMHCTYCYAARYREQLGYPVRLRPVDHVIEEIKQLDKTYGFELLYMQDDIFPLWNRAWLESFCTTYGKLLGKPLHIQVRIEMVRPWMIPLLKEAGVHGVTFAIESGDRELRRHILKRNVKDSRILEGAKLLREAGFRVRIENVLGFPGDTLETALKTLCLNRQCKPDLAWASLFQPYPGTVLGDYAIQQGLFSGRFEILDEDFFTSLPINHPQKAALENLQKLFSLAARYSWIYRLLPLLLRVPPNPFYKKLYHWWKQKVYDDRLFKT